MNGRLGLRHRVALLTVLGVVLAACGTRVDSGPGAATATSTPAGSVGAGVSAVTTPGGSAAASPGAITGLSGGTSAAAGSVGAPGSNTGGAVSSGASGGVVQESPAAGPATGPPILLGAVGTRSGLIGGALVPSWSALLAWQQWINARGGVAGRPVKLIIADDTGDPGKAAALTSQIIQQDHVAAFVGDEAPLTMSGETPVLAQYKVPAIGGDSTDPGWFSSPYAFPLYGSLPSIPNALGIWGSSHLPEKKVAVFYVNEAAAAAQGANTFMQRWKAGGGQVVAQAGVSIAQPDFTAEVLQAKNAGADVNFIFMEDASCTRYFDSASRQQYHPVFLTIGCSIASVAGAGKETAGRAYVGGQFRPPIDNTPEDQAFLAAMQAYAPSVSPMEGLDYYGWLAGRLFELAVAQAHNVITSAALLDAMHQLHNVTFGDIMAPTSWPPGPQAPGKCGVIQEFTGSGFSLLTPNFVCPP